MAMTKTKGRERVCPLCKKNAFYTKDASTYAISRRDNKQKICPECGVREALQGHVPKERLEELTEVVTDVNRELRQFVFKGAAAQAAVDRIIEDHNEKRKSEEDRAGRGDSMGEPKVQPLP